MIFAIFILIACAVIFFNKTITIAEKVRDRQDVGEDRIHASAALIVGGFFAVILIGS
ncbi:hypothetical protein [Alteribacter natronophilus]|uniref:hypothetical protein n=1 Tax=Alteribacter natronophilus TaxID=2583810 RepID=UPI001486A02F|nr:hypothetical protein [Alteribacter natronophilus]